MAIFEHNVKIIIVSHGHCHQKCHKNQLDWQPHWNEIGSIVTVMQNSFLVPPSSSSSYSFNAFAARRHNVNVLLSNSTFLIFAVLVM